MNKNFKGTNHRWSKPNNNFHDWCVVRELKALDNAWECEVQDIYGRFLDAHRYTADGENEIKHKEYLDGVERTLNMELEAVTKVYIKKREEVKAKFLGNVSDGEEDEL